MSLNNIPQVVDNPIIQLKARQRFPRSIYMPFHFQYTVLHCVQLINPSTSTNKLNTYTISWRTESSYFNSIIPKYTYFFLFT